MWKTVNQGERTVLGGNPSLKTNQVGIPKDLCKVLTKPVVVNSLNYGLAEKLIREKKVNYIQKGERIISLKFHKAVIDIGNILHMHLIKGYWVVMNRQSTLHRTSMMGFWVVPQDTKTFKISLTATKPLNADFHGDEINCHVPQNLMATTEVKELMALPFKILSPKNGMPIICVVQDAMVSMYLLTNKKKQTERSMFMQYLMDLDDLNRFNEIVSRLGYTGKAHFSFLLPGQLWHKTSKIQIKNGLLMDGIIDKSSLGSSSLSLMKCIFDNYGTQRAAQFIDKCQFLANRYMLYTGYSIGIDDYVVIPKKVVKMIADNEFLKANPLDPDAAVEDVKNKIMKMPRQQLSQNDNNGFIISLGSGPKGSLFNVWQMTGLLRQQYINGKRLTNDAPQETIFDQRFIVGSFGSGFTPKEFFSHARARGTSLCDTALTTSQTGYSQRKLIKLMEKIVFHNDESARCIC